MRYLSVCSGIEAATAAWHPLGWIPVAFSEIESFPSAVLAARYPDVPNLGDMTKIRGEDYAGMCEVLVGGTPCQAFSVAGLRKSLDDDRGNLTLVFAQLADSINPDFVVWENVPGVLNTKDNAFGCFLGALAGEDAPLEPPGGKWTNAGYVLGPKRAIAWRVLDAQYFGVAQRRRRVFLVACPTGGADPRAVLFESEGVRRDSPPSREAGQEAAGGAGRCVEGGCHPVAPAIRADGPGFERVGDTRGQDPVVVCAPLTGVPHADNEAQETKLVVDYLGNAEGGAAEAPFLTTSNLGKGVNNQTPLVSVAVATPGMQVRRLTEVECERLQGFPDGFTDIAYGRPKYPDQQCPSGHRYKALGNSMAVPCMSWIGMRIDACKKTLDNAGGGC